jgi:hypothetical protein
MSLSDNAHGFGRMATEFINCEVREGMRQYKFIHAYINAHDDCGQFPRPLFIIMNGELVEFFNNSILIKQRLICMNKKYAERQITIEIGTSDDEKRCLIIRKQQ